MENTPLSKATNAISRAYSLLNTSEGKPENEAHVLQDQAYKEACDAWGYAKEALTGTADEMHREKATIRIDNPDAMAAYEAFMASRDVKDAVLKAMRKLR